MICTTKSVARTVLILLACASVAVAQTSQPAPATQSIFLDQLAQQGQAALASGDAATAIKTLNALIQAQPNNTSAMLGLAEAYLRDKNPLQAVEIYNRCRRISPNEWRAEYGLGTIYLQQTYYRLARPFLERALALSPSQPQARGRVAYNLSLCYRGLHQMKEAIDQARQTLALDPTNIDAHRLLINLYAEDNRSEDALAEARAMADAIRASLVKTPDDRQAVENLGTVLSMSADILQQQTSARPSDPSVRLQLADVIEQVAQVNVLVIYHNALAQVDAALKAAPENPDVLYAHARLENLVGSPAKAIEDLQVLLKVAPGDTRGKALLEKIQGAASRPAE